MRLVLFMYCPGRPVKLRKRENMAYCLEGLFKPSSQPNLDSALRDFRRFERCLEYPRHGGFRKVPSVSTLLGPCATFDPCQLSTLVDFRPLPKVVQISAFYCLLCKDPKMGACRVHPCSSERQPVFWVRFHVTYTRAFNSHLRLIEVRATTTVGHYRVADETTVSIGNAAVYNLKRNRAGGGLERGY